VGGAPHPPAKPSRKLDPAKIDQRAAAADGGNVSQMFVVERHRSRYAIEASSYDAGGVAACLLRGIAYAWNGGGQDSGVADDEDIRMPRNAEVIRHLYSASAIGFGTEPSRCR